MQRDITFENNDVVEGDRAIAISCNDGNGYENVRFIDNRVESLRSIAAKLAPGGKILVTVPAYQWMWGAHDLANHHKLRYSKKGLRRDAEAAGLEVRKLGHFNSLLFPLAAAVRQFAARSGLRLTTAVATWSNAGAGS